MPKLRRRTKTSKALRAFRRTVPIPGQAPPHERAVTASKMPSLLKSSNGYPSKYDDENHPLLVLRCMAEGASKAELCLEIGINPDTIYEWEKRHPSFKEAIRIGEQLSQAWWLTLGRKNLWNREFNSILWMMNMQNRHGWTRKMDVSGKAEVEHSGTVTEKKEITLDLSSGRRAEVAAILLGSGLLRLTKAQKAVDAQVVEVHTA